ncbi:two-component system, response regulator, stage 0 sporulation protein F [Candidatus Thermokryptus mobilis]|uniref:Two-component system, response regulator, stage 0 sporulation protein F n=1 Tax=Candidatus Thermokryptus mobilis TaxID=1643428 RepID=A0A0S4N5F7_9BACT|nr:response regulator [Candidatus Thermokryptus mobilis]CUU06428.1 two-component system, response regulator, stage 0 sporulation protein F [Candidatus Thermokryptus mobilis]
MPKRILLVDDDELVRVTLKEFLTILGLEVVEAGNGSEGIKKAQQVEFQILITDYKMPDMTGIEMIREILKFKRDFKIVILSGYVGEITNEKLEGIEVTAILQKPADLGVLERIITQILADLNKTN